MMRSALTAAMLLFLFSAVSTVAKAEPSAAQFATAVVKLDATIRSDARTVPTLGAERSGSAVVIDASGLLVTVGYLVLEAEAVQVTFANDVVTDAEIVTNDTATGLALLRAELPDGIHAMSLGDSSVLGVDHDVVVLPHSGAGAAHVATIASDREFSGSWEYLIDRAFYTTPPTRFFSGAALVNRDAELVGIGSLLLSDIYPRSDRRSADGNMFIPIEHLRKHFGKLLSGQPSVGGRPWLGLTINETLPDLEVVRVAEESPAAGAGIRDGDAIIALNNARVYTMTDFYSALWQAGDAGVEVELLIVRDNEIRSLSVRSADRERWFR